MGRKAESSKKINENIDRIVPKLIVHAIGDGTTTPKFKEISIIGDVFFLGDKAVKTYCDGDYICWSRHNGGGDEETGALKLHPHGLMADGFVKSGGVEIEFSASALVGYTTTYSSDDDSGSPWLEIDMGFELDSNGFRQVAGKVVDPTVKSQTELNKNCTIRFEIDHNAKSQTVFHATIELTAAYCMITNTKFIAAEIDFTMDYRGFEGKLYEYDDSKHDNRGTSHVLSGACKSVTDLQAMLERAQVDNLRLSLASQASSVDGADGQNTIESSIVAEAINSVPLSVNDLFELPTPDLKVVHEEAFTKLKNLMIYSVDDQWRKWFGEVKPTVGLTGDLTQEEVTIAQDPKIKTFLTDQFATGYLTQAFSRANVPNIKKKFDGMPDVQDKLAYFWKGDKPKSCFGRYHGYQASTSMLNSVVYKRNVPTLSRYLENNPTQWAVDLYKFCTNKATLNGLAMQNTLDGRQRLTHLTTVLHILDPMGRIEKKNGKKISYATALYEEVMDCRLKYVISHSSTSDQKDMAEFLTEFFKQYFNSIIAGGKWNDHILAEAKKDLQEAMKEYQVDDANALAEKMGDIIANAVGLMVNRKNIPLPMRLRAWALENPKMARIIKSGMGIGLYGYAIYSTTRTFMQWDVLKPEQKVQAVISVFDLTASMFNDYATYRAMKTLTKLDSSTNALLEAVDQITLASEEVTTIEVADGVTVMLDADMAVVNSPALARAGALASGAVQLSGDLNESASMWADIAKLSGGFAKGMSILMLGASCVVTGFQIANDFDTNQPTAVKVFDILEEVALGVAFLAEAGAGIAAMLAVEVCAIIPVIGTVALVVGVIVCFVLLFIHRKPPPTPEEKFVDNHSAPFLASKVKPSQKWLDKQRKITNRANSKKAAKGSASFAFVPLPS